MRQVIRVYTRMIKLMSQFIFYLFSRKPLKVSAKRTFRGWLIEGLGVDDFQFEREQFEGQVRTFETDEFPVCMGGKGFVQ